MPPQSSPSPTDPAPASARAPRIALLDLSHHDARAAVSSGAPVYLSINPVEYHGPHLPLHNDRIVSAGLVSDLHARLALEHPEWPFLDAGELEVGVEPTAGIGSRHAAFATAREVIREACRALAELGAERVVLMTFHGSPMHGMAIQAGVDLLTSRGVQAFAPFNAVLRELTGLDGSRFAEAFVSIEDPAERSSMVRDAGLDFHAGFFETSMTLHYAPASVWPGYRSLPPCPAIVPNAVARRASDVARAAGAKTLADELMFAANALGWHALRPFPGYTGRPHRASASVGAFFARAIIDLYAPLAEEIFSGRGRSPEPIMAWTRALTMDGRLTPPPPPIQARPS